GAGVTSVPAFRAGVRQFVVGDFLPLRLRLLDLGFVPVLDSIFRRMAVSFPRLVDVYPLFAVGHPDSLRTVGDLGWVPLRDDFRATYFAGSWNGDCRAGRSFCFVPKRE